VNRCRNFFIRPLILLGRPFYYLIIGSFIFIFVAVQKVRNLSFPILKRSQELRFPNKAKVSVAVIMFTISFTIFTWHYIFEKLPDPKMLSQRRVELSTKIYDRNHTLLYTVYKDKNRTPVKLNDLPSYVINSFLAAEDAAFYQHSGFSIKGMARATLKYLNTGQVTGGSTITQQLVKNALLTPEKTIRRKIREIYLATKIESIYSKDEILEMYLNEVGFGGTAYGIEEASKLYFNKKAKDLSLAEAALLAGLPQSPTKYSPFGTNPELSISRQQEVLRLMVENGFIDKEQMFEAKKQTIQFAPNRIDIKAPHFVMYVKNLLVEKYGEEIVEKGGLEVITTLDLNLQNMAQEIVRNKVASLQQLDVGNGAAMIVKPQTGEVIAMVGSTDYFDTENGGNVNVLLRLRQPGSSVKTINYAYALSHGYSPASLLKDEPITFKIPGSFDYSPQNYDGRFVGNLTLREALAQSRNIPAVRVLNSYGINKMIELGQKLGITSWTNSNRYGLSLTLGGADVYLYDLTQVYATLANYGTRVNLKTIKQIKAGNKLVYKDPCFDNICPGQKVLDPRVAFILTDILKDNQARTPAFGANSSLAIPGYEVAVKTGTSNNLRDNVTVGYTPDWVVATWVGNNDNSPMSHVASGVTGASPIWNEIMTNLLADSEAKNWNAPEGLKQISVCGHTDWFLQEANLPSCPDDHKKADSDQEKQFPPQNL